MMHVRLLKIIISPDFRISLIRNGDRIPSHEQIVIQEYIDRVRTTTNFNMLLFFMLFIVVSFIKSFSHLFLIF